MFLALIGYLQYVQAAAALFLAWRVFQCSLYRTMKAMLTLQLWTILSSLATVTLYPYQRYFKIVYLLLVPITVLVDILAVRELFAVVFDKYPGIRTIGRWTMYGGVAISITFALILTRIFWIPPADQARVFYTIVLYRSVSFSLAIFILIILFFLSRYPLQLPRNFSVSGSLFCAVFLVEALGLLWDTLHHGDRSLVIDSLATGISATCLCLWGYLLQPASADKFAQLPSETQRQSVEESELLDEIERLNRMMGRAVGR